MPSGVVHNDKIYIINDANPQVYDPKFNAWSKCPTPGVNFINILHVCFLYESALHSIFGAKILFEKGMHKMLMKLTPAKPTSELSCMISWKDSILLFSVFRVLSFNTTLNTWSVLNAGVNFINILQVPFAYKSLFGSFSLVTCK